MAPLMPGYSFLIYLYASPILDPTRIHFCVHIRLHACDKSLSHITETQVPNGRVFYEREVHVDSDVDRSQDGLMVLPILIAEHVLPWVTGLLLQPNSNTPK